MNKSDPGFEYNDYDIVEMVLKKEGQLNGSDSKNTDAEIETVPYTRELLKMHYSSYNSRKIKPQWIMQLSKK